MPEGVTACGCGWQWAGWEQPLRALWTRAYGPEKRRTCSLSVLPPGPGDIPKTLVRAVAPPLATMPCPLCAGIRGVMPPPLFPMSWKKWAG